MSEQFKKYMELFTVFLKADEEYIRLLEQVCPVSWGSEYKTPERGLDASTAKELENLKVKRDQACKEVDEYLKTIKF